MKTAYAHFDANGGYNSHHLYNPSKGFIRDVVRFGLEKIGYETRSIKLAREFMDRELQAGKDIFSVWHSEGGLIGKRAIETSQFPSLMFDRTSAYTLGTAAAFPNSLVYRSKNYISSKDPIPGFASLIHPIKRADCNVQIIDSQENSLFDHSHESRTYAEALTQIYKRVRDE